jgi:hypothetical protein
MPLFTEDAIAHFKTNYLPLLSDSLPVDAVSDALIGDLLKSAEAELSRVLRVFFEPTVVLPEDAKPEEIKALEAPYFLEAPYDYEPHGWQGDTWGYILLRQTPVIRIDSIVFSYPNPTDDVVKIPSAWIRADLKYGHVRFVPTGISMALGPMSTFMLSAISSGRVIPNMIHVRYVAGLENAAEKYPDLMRLLYRMAQMNLMKSLFLPSSGSISGDGLSETASFDMAKWQGGTGGIDDDIRRLQDSIHGPRFEVF